MEQQPRRAPSSRPAPRKRRKKTRMEQFKEAYLPLVIGAVAVLGIILMIVGAVRHSKAKRNQAAQEASRQEAESISASLDLEQAGEGEALLAQAKALAAQYDYDGALTLLRGFSGDPAHISGMSETISEYEAAQAALVAWPDPKSIPHISFQPLIADPALAFDDDKSAKEYNCYNVTTDEFQAILQQLYDNGFVLVSLHDVAAPVTGSDGKATYQPGQILLPEGKKPLILSEVPVNYYSDGDDNGFAMRLVVGSDGRPACEMKNAAGETVTGPFDLVPLLDAFLDTHPDFSYRGAKAILAVTGYAGVLGYDTQPSAKNALGEEAYAQEIADAKAVAQCLTEDGYIFASFTYSSIPYGVSGLETVAADVKAWQDEVAAIVGATDILFYASGSDISDTAPYAGSKYETLYNAGFRYFCGLDPTKDAWGQIADNYVRQTRRTVTGYRLDQQADLLDDLFDAGAVISSVRPRPVPAV